MDKSIWVRSLVNKQFSPEEFFKHVVSTIGKEFKLETYVSIHTEAYKFFMEEFEIIISRKQVKRFQESGLYLLDKYILDELEDQGLEFNINRSKYVRCCYGIFDDDYTKDKITTRFNQIFNIPVKEGSLFYPCCGLDTYEPLALFMNSINEFHFAHGESIILPTLECEVKKGTMIRNKSYNKKKNELSIDTIPFAIQMENKKNYEILKELEEEYLDSFAFIKIEDISTKEIWKTKFSKNPKIEIYSHKFEGFISLYAIENIAVFYYRTYQIGEDTLDMSPFNWLSPIAFNAILDKLVDGAILILDGEDPEIGYEVPWSGLWREKYYKDFIYREKRFSYIGEFGERYDKMKVWKVDFIKNKA
ncbi:hypothetical protein [Clostridium tetani]|uniref:hypothetical protein n=1 Tax=Clostridium tetani TaxID=1513 RepID=UPI0005139C17|nr:hypothetical protein [Clostridium tetani]KGI42248.1 hypothetical protein KY55_09110 [Clostridium tetani]RXI71877.1 hypothetical protein DP127_06315 [Clostridium tetani]BDR74985.1 hypothetical protein K154306013_06450 [Clostridium tetani]BDR86050.1 hypothetical protein N071400001_06580 [Clostridium tetani]